MFNKPLLRWGFVVVLIVAAWAIPSLSDHGYYHPDQHWSEYYFKNFFRTEDALAAGFIFDPTCEPGMGYHYFQQEAAEMWFSGQSGGMHVLLYDDTGFLVGIEFIFTAPGPDAPVLAGMEGPTAPHIDGMPWHYEKHLYFQYGNGPVCNDPGMHHDERE